MNNTVHDAKLQVRRLEDQQAKDNLREMSQPGVLPGADDVLDPGVDAVGGVGVGALAPPAPGASGQVRRPQRVAPPVGRLEERQLRARVRALPFGR